ncbi:SCP-like protein [Oesophagostomum dentatum]|uniref:SCP-like protein n=1 Tax=Oesophagostomum dentatum TaxID=61180 RepID=A0A0B1T0A6_OESDE|nr:SCP-like protein [Oesophagostomum dentatum]
MLQNLVVATNFPIPTIIADPDGKENGSQDRDSSGMTNQIRNAFLNMHNTLRSKLARGVIKNGRNGKMFKKARRMPKLVYNRGLEKQASKRASECGYQFSIPDQLKESYRRVHPSERNEPKYRRNFARLAKDVVKGWWNEIYNLPNGIDETQNVNPYRLHITSFAKIASDLTTEVGCGFSRCKYSTIVICSYKTSLTSKIELEIISASTNDEGHIPTQSIEINTVS